MDIQIPCAYPVLAIEGEPTASVNYGTCNIDFSCRL